MKTAIFLQLNLLTPSSYWSLWVPLLLLIFVVLAAVYFVRVNIR